MNHFVITIGRQIGAGGLEVARKLSQDLGVKMYDRDLISEFSHQSGLRSELFEQRDERHNFLKIGSFFGLRSTIQGNSNTMANNVISDESLFEIQSDAINNLAQKESCIIVGRCSDYVLRHCEEIPREDIMTVFIYAPLEDKVKRAIEENGLDPATAERDVKLIDKRRANHYNTFTERTWGNKSHYDLLVNSSLLGIENTAKMIAQVARTV